MLKYIILILLAIAVYNTRQTTPGLEEYIARYEKLTGTTFDTPVTLVTPSQEWIENRYAGVCYMYSFPYTRYIEINEVSWSEFSDTEKILLLAHENFHCKFNRLHTSELYRGLPVSLMHPVLLDETLFSMLESEYIHELVTGDTTLVKQGIDKILDKRTNYVER